MELFISYSSNDKPQAETLGNRLRSEGFEVWRDQEGIPPGGSFPLVLRQALLRCDAVIYLNTATAKQSEWVNNELNFAQSQRKLIIPLLLEDDSELPLVIFTRQGIKFHEDWEAGFALLVQHLRRLDVETPTPSTAEIEEVFEPKTAPLSVHSADDSATTHSDPFWFGSAIPESLFVGRAEVLDRIRTAVVGRFDKVRSVSIVGNRRIGKTSILNYVVKRHQDFLPAGTRRIFVYMDMSDARAREIPELMRYLRRGIARQIGRDPWHERHDGTISRLSDAIQELAEDERTPLVLCLDEWDKVMAYPQFDRLLETLRVHGSEQNLSMIIASADSLYDLTVNAQIGSPFYNIFEQAVLGLMPRPEWTRMVENAFAESGEQISWSEGSSLLDRIERMTGGHPYLVNLAGSLFWRARRQGWPDDEIDSRYRMDARSLFTWTLQSLKPEQSQALRVAAGAAADTVAENTWRDLYVRGLVDSGNQVFCEPFAQFLNEQLI